MTVTAPFFAIEQSIRQPSGTTPSYARAWAAAPWGALWRTESAFYVDTVLRASDVGYSTGAADTPALVPYPPRVQEAFSIDAELDLDPASAAVAASWGSINLLNDDGIYNALPSAGWLPDGRTVKVLYGTKTFEDFAGYASGSATGGTWLDESGVLESAPARTVREDYTAAIALDPSATNWYANAAMAGAVVGTLGSGGALPTGWIANSLPTGLSLDVVAAFQTTVGGGKATVLRLRYHGTPTTNPAQGIDIPTALSGLGFSATISQSLYIALTAGSFANVSAFAHWGPIRDVTGANVVDLQPDIRAAITGTLAQLSRTEATPGSGNYPFNVPFAGFTFSYTANQPIDFMLDIAAVQLEIAGAPTAFIPTSVLPLTRGRGAVNYLRNSSCAGAVTGTPGTLPTNWAYDSLSGLSSQVVATGTDAGTGLPYVDLRLFGTSSGTFVVMQLEGSTVIDANTGQTWTGSYYAKVVAGSQSGVTFNVGIRENDASGTGLINDNDTASPLQPSTAALSIGRKVITATLGQATTRYVCLLFSAHFSSGVAIDVTVRLAGPMLAGGNAQEAPIATSSVAASRAPTYGVTALPAVLDEPDETNYVLSSSSPSAADATVAASADVPALCAGRPVWKHTRTAGNTGTHDGSLAVSGLPSSGVAVRASAWVWIPKHLASKTSITFDIEGNSTGGVTAAADLTKTGQWQRLVATATTNGGATSTSLVVRTNTEAAGDVLYSTCWEIKVDSGATTSFIVPAATPALRAGDRLYTAREIWIDPAYSTLQPAFVGVAGPWQLTDVALSIPLRDASYWLERPLLRSTYGGTGGYDGTAGLAGTLKPLAIGGPQPPGGGGGIQNVSPMLIDPANLIYQISDGFADVCALYEGGYGGGITFAGDVADLYVGSTPSGQYRTSRQRGCFQLGSAPTFAITCDVYGLQPNGDTSCEFLTVAYYVLTNLCGVPASHVASAPLFGNPLTLASIGPIAEVSFSGGCGLWLGPNDNATGIDVLARILSPICNKLVGCRDGKLRAYPLLDITGASASVTLDDDDVVSVAPAPLPAAVDPPPYRMRVGYDTNYTVQTSGLSGSATAARKQYIATPGSAAQSNSPDVTAALIRPNDPPIVGQNGSIVDAQFNDAATIAGYYAGQQTALWGVRRRLYEVAVPFLTGIALDYGSVVTLKLNFDDLAAGKIGQVVGYRYSSVDSTITLRVLV